jgi:MFS family permease
MPSRAELTMGEPARSTAPAPNTWSWRSTGYAWWVVIVLALGLTLSLMDRLIIALMIGPIKRDLSLSDTDIGLLQGLAFTLLYVLAGLPLGRLADRSSRRGLAALSIMTWSVMTAVCGLTSSFGQLFIARLGVGVGEAGLSPAAISLISDYFPKHQRARPLAFLSIGTTAGAGLALMFGGAMVHAIGASKRIVLPLLGGVQGWQAVFLLLGAFGVLFGGIFFSVREPERRERSALREASVADVLHFLWQRKGYFVAQFLGSSFAVLTLIAFHSWAPTLFIRRFHWNTAETGMAYGGCIGLAGISGIVLGGWAAERWAGKGDPGAPLSVAALAALGAALPMAAATLLPHPWWVLAALFVGMTLLVIPSALTPAVLQSVCPNEMRGQVFSVYLLVMSIFGYALGPLSVAWITDHVLHAEHRLHLSLALVAAIAVPAAAVSLAAARRRHRALIALPAACSCRVAGGRRPACNQCAECGT